VEKNRNYLPTGIAGLLVLFTYVWFIGVGPWRARGYTSDYYSQLSTSFQRGQLSLETKPDPALLSLPDPYDLKARKGIPVVGDASLYKGKYYLYFGPLPSLVLAGINSILPLKPGDQFFVYLFIVGIFCVQSLLFIAIFRYFFAGLPNWIIPLGILVLGLTGPFTRMLTHPFIHEAAISAGQFFFLAGYYFAFLALKEKPISNRKLLLASIFWACSVATRITQLVPISFMVVITWLFIFSESRKEKLDWKFGSATLILVSPLLLCGAILAWYNWARFDSIFEFGFYYQLAGFNLQANYPSLFSRVYIIQNIYTYFMNPFEVRSSFPFAYPLAGSEEPIFSFYELPRIYAVEGKFAGLLYSTPFLIFSILPALMLVIRFIRAIGRRDKKKNQYNFYDWTIISLIGSFVAGSIPTLLIFYVGFRYETEFITSLSMLGLIGFCQGYLLLKTTTARKLIAISGMGLAAFSVLASIALAFTGRSG
jgi:hypothetical protein